MPFQCLRQKLYKVVFMTKMQSLIDTSSASKGISLKNIERITFEKKLISKRAMPGKSQGKEHVINGSNLFCLFI